VPFLLLHRPQPRPIGQKRLLRAQKRLLQAERIRGALKSNLVGAPYPGVLNNKVKKSRHPKTLATHRVAQRPVSTNTAVTSIDTHACFPILQFSKLNLCANARLRSGVFSFRTKDPLWNKQEPHFTRQTLSIEVNNYRKLASRLNIQRTLYAALSARGGLSASHVERRQTKFCRARSS
jgi:hypothetical protein